MDHTGSSATPSDPARGRLHAELLTTFGYPSFRPLQEEIVSSILAGRDVFALMPTGGGKSLCYQLPALLLEGTAVVVSPLIALMKDQVDALRELGVAATYINSSLDAEEVSVRQHAVADGKVKLVYVAPERLMLPGFLRLLASARISFFAVDEAHCISEWGHDFRPEYRELRRLRAIFPSRPIAAFTATATTRVRTDIASQLSLRDPAIFRGRFNRPNLYYDVRPKRNALGSIVQYIRSHPHTSGIVYCATRRETEDLAVDLRDAGIEALPYHAGLTDADRHRNQDAFIRDEVQVMVATVAFGMGINKPDVRFVMHHSLPHALENYYQESGRAGRDGDPSDCILYYTAGDAMRLRFLAGQKEGEDERRIALAQAQGMIDWAESTTCRRARLLAYFDEPFEGQDGPCCDVCAAPVGEEVDVTVEAQKLLSCVVRTGERFGVSHVVAVLRGSQNKKVLHLRHERLSTYGIGKDRPEGFWLDLARHLIGIGALRQDQERYNTLSVTGAGRRILFEGQKVAMRRRPDQAALDRGDAAVANPELFERLRALRRRMADERNVPPYFIFQDRVLREMSARMPARTSELLSISGVGQRRAQVYGSHFLAEIRQYRDETGALPQEPAVAEPPVIQRRRRVGDSAAETVRLFHGGHTPADVARLRGVTLQTVYSHLTDAIECGQIEDINRLVSPERQSAIKDAFDRVGNDLLSPVRDFLGDGYSYEELRVVRAQRNALRAAESSPTPSPG